MDKVLNPYSPGAGSPPPALVGREKPLDATRVALKRALVGRPFRPPLLVGLRGVGKTVLLREFMQEARRLDFLTAQVEVDEQGEFTWRIAAEIRAALYSLSFRHRARDLTTRALGVLKGFTIRWPSGPELHIDVDAVQGPADSGDLGTDLAGLLRAVGEAARQAGTGLCIAVDEVQYLGVDDLSGFVMALHRLAQDTLPVVVCLAGLPSVYGPVGHAKSYAERLFHFEEIGSLSGGEARAAVSGPAAEQGVSWRPPALDRLFALSEGYPFFLQEFASKTWDAAAGPDISEDDVMAAEPAAIHDLDVGFFRVRFDRTTDAERRYLRAMAQLGEGPCSSADIARVLGKTARQLGPVRARLIQAGLCYSPRWGQIAFTVPMFDRFLRRAMP